MAEYKYFFNDKPVSEQEWYEMVDTDTDTVEITVGISKVVNCDLWNTDTDTVEIIESNIAEEQLSLF